MLLLYTFCCDIGKHTKSDLIMALNTLMNSIHKNILNYQLLCFSNFTNELSKKIDKKYNIEFREYYNNDKFKLYSDKWLNLSFNKINIYKDLHDEFNKDFCWIDLDTIICHDISYINDLSNVFIENGGTCSSKNVLFSNNNYITLPRNRYIQGNFWKLNIELYICLVKTLHSLINKNLILRYDLQDLFSYYIYIENNGENQDINILGNNIKNDSINGLSIWSVNGDTHATQLGMDNLYLDNNMLKSKFYPEKSIHILSFTFNTLKQLNNSEKFKELFIY
jgi:hypothetical protein